MNRRLTVIATTLALVLPALFVLNAFMPTQSTANAATETETKTPSLLRHVVLFKFNDSATPEQVQEIVTAFAKLPGQIDSIVDFEYGTDNSPEGLADGFTHCFTVTFKSEEGREKYLPHPAHKAFVKILQPHLEKVLVVDYWTKK